ncbi:hypothetical protein BU24DRAFT_431801 [Aaosphaeria arxii CBS 175.79]|uniref:Uncharacterized protein n=1 Tax=Aaosphaeria arxii CBS 175.79 TaxID=1450172 RepID=A0A6A5XW36_9PLEO|nr:uncharacterized protein BU24DRAFT_431801 [Aaosphaeria arxii CBS 175.79]KAF2016850.1 hypothetical protein BU24DRAFT_431801 [Aaosphaeria arxii CBS 175.79]
MSLATSVDAPLCPDWVFVSSANRSPNRSGVSNYGSIHLQQVLHAPNVVCNIIGIPMCQRDGYTLSVRSGQGKSNGTIADERGRQVGYLRPGEKWLRLKVRGHPVGPRLGASSMQKGHMYMLGVQWDVSEQRRWLGFLARKSLVNDAPESTAPTSTTVSDEVPPLTSDEKDYLKRNWGDEYHLLIQHGLSIYKDEDRAVGRELLRATRLMDGEGEDDEDEEDDEDVDEFSSFEGHQVDYNFSEKELDWIERNFGTAVNFMQTYGLKFYVDEDCEEAKIIARAMMEDDHV